MLDFFELIALLVQRKVVDPEMAWHAYYWPLATAGAIAAFEMDIGIASACGATLVLERWETRLLVKCG